MVGLFGVIIWAVLGNGKFTTWSVACAVSSTRWADLVVSAAVVGGIWLNVAVLMVGAWLCSDARSPIAAVLVPGIIVAIATIAHVDRAGPPVPLGPHHCAYCQCPVLLVGVRRLVVFKSRRTLDLCRWCCWWGVSSVAVGCCWLRGFSTAVSGGWVGWGRGFGLFW